MQISPNLHFQVTLQVDLKWPLTLICDLLTTWTFEGSILSINQVWFQSDFQLFKWGHFHIFSLFYNLTSDDLWPLFVTFDLINKWGFPCCIYGPTLAVIHQSMWKLETNANPFSQQTTTTVDKVIPRPIHTCVFPAKAGDTKTMILHQNPTHI